MGFSDGDWRKPCSRREPCDRRCQFPSLAIGRSHTTPDFGSTRPASFPPFHLVDIEDLLLAPDCNHPILGPARPEAQVSKPTDAEPELAAFLDLDARGRCRHGAAVVPANESDTRRRRSQLWRLSPRASSSRSLPWRGGRPDRGRGKSGPTWSE